jgi:hypothetical protein
MLFGGKLDMTNNQTKQGVYHTMALSFIFKSILRQKKNYKNSNISPCLILGFRV